MKVPKKYADIRITVLKKLRNDDVFRAYAAEGVHPVCRRYREGQFFLCKNVTIPEGFCSWAWPVIQEKAVFLALGHDYPWIRQRGTEIVSCPDGLHPILYKLERVQEGSEGGV